MTGVQTCALPILFELVMALEDEYNIEIPAEDLTDLTTVGAVMDYLKNKGVEA